MDLLGLLHFGGKWRKNEANSGLLHGKVGGLGAFEDAVHEQAAEAVRPVRWG
jgi:hypothetical protein